MPDSLQENASEFTRSQAPSPEKRDSAHGPESRLTLNELSPEVKPFAIHLSEYILSICKKHGIESNLDTTNNTNLSQAVSDSVAQFIEKFSSDPSLMQDAKKLLELQQLLTSIHETNKIPEEEQKRMTINANPLENPFAYVHAAAELYTSLDLPEWAPPVNTTELIEQMSPENRELVEKYQREGWIAMYMPSRTVQMETLAKAVQKLKPLWIEDGIIQALNETQVLEYIAKLIVDKHPDLFKDVPDQPYFDLTNPTPNVLPNTVNKTVDEQKVEFARLKALDPNLSVMGIPGFVAIQAWGTRVEFVKQSYDGIIPFKLSPFDDGTKSHTRFIDLPFSDDGFVPSGYCDPHVDGLFVGLSQDDTDIQNPQSGFRLSVRVPIA